MTRAEGADLARAGDRRGMRRAEGDLAAAALARAPALTVRSLRVRAVELPLDRPTETAAGAMASTPLALLDLATEQGATGHAYVACYSRAGLAAVVAALHTLELAGRRVASLYDDLRRDLFLTGTAGVLGYALGGLDMAAWDALARAAGQPLAVLLGGQAGTRVPAYGSLRRAEEAAARRAEGGFAHLKVKVTRDTDRERIAAVRATGARVMVDYNQSLTLAEALAKVERLDAEDLTWIEEPLPAQDLAAYAQLTRTARTPIQAGESWWSADEAQRAFAARAQDLAMPDVARIGGVTGFLRAAGAADVPVSSHMYPEVSAHLLAALPNAHLLEHLDKTHPLLARPLAVRDGHVTVPDAPGSGVEWDESAVARFSA